MYRDKESDINMINTFSCTDLHKEEMQQKAVHVYTGRYHIVK